MQGAMQMKLNIICQLFGNDGYASHSRQFCKGLIEAGADVRIETPLQPGWEAQCSDGELLAIQKPWSKERTTIMIAQPPWWRLALAQKTEKFVGVCVWEGEKVPKHWLPHLADERVDLIFTPSEHVKMAIEKTVEDECYGEEHNSPYCKISAKIRIVPHGVDLSIFQPQPRKEDEPFRFLCNKGWSKGLQDRGGVQYALIAYALEFRANEPVVFRVKINTSYCQPGWNLQAELEKLNLPKDRAPIEVTTDMVEYKKLPSFYSGDVFLAPTRSEAFGLTCIEAMACGIPVIATNFGGQTDFITNDNGWLIGYDLEEVTWDVAYESNKWGTPRIEELRKAMREAYENRASTKRKAANAQTTAQSYTWLNAAKKAMEALR